MASTKEYLDFVLEQLSELDEVSSRAMMGEYILYYRGKVFGGIYDDRLLVKPVPAALKLMPDVELELPYDGAKEIKELNKISWNGAETKYDIRDWAPEREKMGKGVTLTEEEAAKLKELL